MWEWRLFFPEEEKEDIPFYNKIKSIVESSPLETRFDYYYLINDDKIGLKERGPPNSIHYEPKLELKIQLTKSNWGGEHWIKPIKLPIKGIINQNEGLDKKKIISLLTKFQKDHNNKLNNQIEFIINEFYKKTIPRIKTKKYRKQIPIAIKNQIITVEHTKIILKDEVWETFEIEGSVMDSVQSFVKEHITLKKGLVMGYPEFLLRCGL